ILLSKITSFVPNFQILFATSELNIFNIYNNTDTLSTSSFSSPKSSPSFGMQQIENLPHHWVDEYRGIPSTKGSNFTDIRYINYFSDGQFLNATMWLDGFTSTPPTDRKVNYGMYIDSDFDNNTGIDGIDYKVEIHWNPDSKSWTRSFEEWSTNSKNKTIESTQNFTDFYQKGGSFVNLYVDLKDMMYPQKYRVLFYAEEIKTKGVNWIINYPNWINIPPPKFIISVNPSIINVKAGEPKTVELQVASSQGFQPHVNFFTDNSQNTSFVKYSFLYNNIPISSTGEATTLLTIYTTSEAIRLSHNAIIYANFSFPTQVLPRQISDNIKVPTKNVISSTLFTIIIQDPPSPIDYLNDFWNKTGGFINFVYLAGVAAVSWIFTTYIKNRKDNNKSTNA